MLGCDGRRLSLSMNASGCDGFNHALKDFEQVLNWLSRPNAECPCCLVNTSGNTLGIIERRAKSIEMPSSPDQDSGFLDGMSGFDAKQLPGKYGS